VRWRVEAYYNRTGGAGRKMTTLLKKAFQEVSRLSDIEQNAFAKWVLEELEANRKWDSAFAESEDVLSMLADEAVEADREGKTKPLDIDTL
jgi:hypothetical protein